MCLPFPFLFPIPYFIFLISLLFFPSYQPATSLWVLRSRFRLSSGIPEAIGKRARRKPEESRAKTEGISLFSEAFPKAATLLGVFYVGNKLFFVVYELIVNGLGGVVPPLPPQTPVFAN